MIGEGEVPPDRPHMEGGGGGKKRKKERKDLTAFFFLPPPFSLRKNPAERMNYLELMVSLGPSLLAFIWYMKCVGIKGPGQMVQQDAGVISRHTMGWA